jgi:AraC family transcriptional regulator
MADMPATATDTFVEFVDHLVDVLDDHDTGPEELAARMHFSRFHFDRMIRSVAGEPPSAFRRRILLERAAYRMITTIAPLIDIAVEAGYGSHEAFTAPSRRRTAYLLRPGASSRATPRSLRPAACTSIRQPGCGCRRETR